MSQTKQTFGNDKNGPIYVSVEPWPECFELEPGDRLTLIWETPDTGDMMETYFINDNELVVWPNADSVSHKRQTREGSKLEVQASIMTAGSHRYIGPLVRESKKNLLWPVASFLSPDLRDERYEPSKNRAAAKVVMAETDPDISVLIYHIFAAGTHRHAPDISFCTKTERAFKNFKLFIYSCHFDIPSSDVGSYAFVPTRPPTVNKVHTGDLQFFENLYPDGSDSIADSDVEKIIHELTSGMYAHHMSYWAHHFPEHHAELMKRRPLITLRPVRSGEVLLVNRAPERWSPPTR